MYVENNLFNTSNTCVCVSYLKKCIACEETFQKRLYGKYRENTKMTFTEM
jgi:hypothetical protein